MSNDTYILVAVHNEIENLRVCIESIRECVTLENVRIVVIDNASDDGTAEWLSGQEDIAYATEDRYESHWGKLVNEAIELFGIDGDILFLQPRYRLTDRCLENMKEALYRYDNAAAVGPLIDGNNCSTHIAIDEIEVKNASAKRVIGLGEDAVMVRYDALAKLGKMEEAYYLYTYAIIDYLLRAVQADMELYCVTGALVQGDSGVAEEDDEKLQREDEKITLAKWGMRYFTRECNKTLIDMMTQKREEEITVLEIGCDCGATLLEIKNTYPNAKTYGYEINENAVAIASHVAEAVKGNVEEKNLPYQKEQFDYILFGDVLEHLHDPEETVRYCRNYLKEDGCIIACIPNLMHIAVIRDLLSGYFTYQETGLLDKTHIHMFTFYEIVRMFTNNDYEIENIILKENPISEEDREFLDKLMTITPHNDRYLFTTFQYVVRARKRR